MIRRQRGLLVGAALLLVAALVAGFLAVRQADRADDQRGGARSAPRPPPKRGEPGPGRWRPTTSTRSMLLAVAGVRLDDSTATRANLLAVLQQRPQLVRSVAYDGDPVTGVVRQPGRQGSGDLRPPGRPAALQHHDLGDPREVDSPDDRIPLQWIAPMAFSPDGALLAAGPFGRGRVTRPCCSTPALSSRHRCSWPGCPSGPLRVVDVDFSADGSRGGDHPTTRATVRLLVAGDHRALRVGAAATHDAAPLVDAGELPEDGWFRSSRVELSPDGRTAYTSMPLAAYDVESGRGDLHAGPRARHRWRPADHQQHLRPQPGRTLCWPSPKPLIDSCFSMQRLDGCIATLRGHRDLVTALQFSHDGRSLASSSLDRTGIVWDVATGAVREELRLGEGALALAFSPDDATLYSTARTGRSGCGT